MDAKLYNSFIHCVWFSTAVLKLEYPVAFVARKKKKKKRKVKRGAYLRTNPAGTSFELRKNF